MDMDTDARERAESAAAARSPLALRFDLIGCEYAQMRYPTDQAIPEYHFEHPCVFGKSIPDQDCRDCAHVRILSVGGNQEWHTHRYHRFGLIIPVSEAQADAVVDLLEAQQAQPLRRPAWEDQAAAAAAARAAQAASHDIERQQAGPYGTIPIRQEG